MAQTTQTPNGAKSGVLIRRRKPDGRCRQCHHARLEKRVGLLPPRCRSIVRRVNQASRELQASIERAHGRAPTLTERCRLDEYRDWLAYGLKLMRWQGLAACEMTGR